MFPVPPSFGSAGPEVAVGSGGEVLPPRDIRRKGLPKFTDAAAIWHRESLCVSKSWIKKETHGQEQMTLVSMRWYDCCYTWGLGRRCLAEK